MNHILAVGFDRVGQQRIARGAKVIVVGQHAPLGIEQRQHGVGLGADGAGRNVEHQVLAGASLEREAVDVTFFGEHAPGGRAERHAVGLGQRAVGFGFFGLRQIVDVESLLGAFAGRRYNPQLVAAAGHVRRRRDLDVERRAALGREDLGRDLVMAGFDGVHIGQMLAAESHARGHAALHAMYRKRSQIGLGRRRWRHEVAARGVIEGHRTVEPPDGHELAVGADRQGRRPVALPLEREPFVHRFGVPDLDATVFSGRSDRLAVRRVDQVHHGAFVGKAGVEERIRVFLALGADLPDADPIVDAAGSDAVSVRTEGDAVLFLGRLAEGVEPLTAGHVPQLDRAVAAGAGQNLAVGPEGQVEHRVVVTGERPQFAAAGDFPQLDLLIVAAGGQQLAVGTQHGRIETVLVALENAHGLAVGDVPQPHFAEDAGLAGRGQEPAAVLGKADRVDSPAMRAQPPQERSLRHGQ